jgi:glycosyltransferase involved in cell wall biosynthesis
VKKNPGPDSLLIIVPAYNEAGAVGDVVRELRATLPDTPVLVIDDCSTDATLAVASQTDANVLRLPHHLGLGGCVQAGYKLAFELGYDYVIRLDGDGQHDPKYIETIFRTLKESGCQMVIGSRYVAENGKATSVARGLGIRFFRAVLWPILGQRVSDPTSGYVGVNRQALAVFSRSFPLEYPEIEALVVLQRRAFRFREVPVVMRPRKAGKSSITTVRSFFYIVHVLLGVFVNILKVDRSRWRR